MSYMDEACEKLEREAKAGKFDRYGNAMKSDVLKALKEFCRQSEVFSEAVVKGRSFEECMKEVGKGVSGGSISDLAAFKRAVKYYMENATVRFQMEIRIGGAAEKEDKPVKPSKPTAEKPSEVKTAAEQPKVETHDPVMIDLTELF